MKLLKLTNTEDLLCLINHNLITYVYIDNYDGKPTTKVVLGKDRYLFVKESVTEIYNQLLILP